MSDEIIRINVEADLDRIETVFKKPNISRSFKRSYEGTEPLIRVLIVEYRKALLADPEFDMAKDCIPHDDELILLEFKKALKGQIFAEAISNVFTELKLNVEKNILELIEPLNMIQLFPDAMESTFTVLINDSLFDEDSEITLQMLS